MGLYNLPIEDWPRIWWLEFRDMRGGYGMYKTGISEGAEKGRSKVHSIRPDLVGNNLGFNIYYVIDGTEEEIFWKRISSEHVVTFDTKGSLGEGGIQ